MMGKTNKFKRWFFEKMNNIEKLLTRLLKKKKKRVGTHKQIKSEMKQKLQPKPQKYKGS